MAGQHSLLINLMGAQSALLLRSLVYIVYANPFNPCKAVRLAQPCRWLYMMAPQSCTRVAWGGGSQAW